MVVSPIGHLFTFKGFFGGGVLNSYKLARHKTQPPTTKCKCVFYQEVTEQELALHRFAKPSFCSKTPEALASEAHTPSDDIEWQMGYYFNGGVKTARRSGALPGSSGKDGFCQLSD